MTIPKNRPSEDKKADLQDAHKKNLEAHRQADRDIQNDIETSAHSPNDDLDEGELARLGDKDNPVK